MRLVLFWVGSWLAVANITAFILCKFTEVGHPGPGYVWMVFIITALIFGLLSSASYKVFKEIVKNGNELKAFLFGLISGFILGYLAGKWFHIQPFWWFASGVNAVLFLICYRYFKKRELNSLI